MNPMVGSWNDLVPEGRTPLPASMRPMPDAKQIEKPFVVTFSGSDVSYLCEFYIKINIQHTFFLQSFVFDI